MNWLSQTIAVTRSPCSRFRSGSARRSWPSSASAASSSSSSAVLSIAEGFRAAMQGTGDPRTVIVMRSGSDTEMTSGFSGEEARLITEAPGIERGPDGVHASPELFVIIGHPLQRSGTDANVPLRGLTPMALQGAAAVCTSPKGGCSRRAPRRSSSDARRRGSSAT